MSNGAPSHDDGRITYSTKELLSRIDAKLDLLSMQVQSKADVSTVSNLANRLDLIERDPIWVGRLRSIEEIAQTSSRLDHLEKNTLTVEAINRYKKWLLVVAAPAVIGAIWAVIRVIDLLRGGAF